MSKMGNWVLEMQEDASYMTKETFIKTHGSTQLNIWEEINGEDSYGSYGEPYLGTGSQNRYVHNVNSGYGDEIPF